MVLSLMRRHAKSYIIKFLIGMIAVVFIFYFGYSFRAQQAVKVATVNGEVITGAEYQETYRNLLEALQRQYKGYWNDNLIEAMDLKNRALENLIDQKLISQEARRLGLGVTEAEIQEAISNYPAFQTNGQFDMGRYLSLLNRNRMEPEDFEEAMTHQLLERKLRQFLFSFMGVTHEEIREHYVYNHEKIKISFVQFEPEEFTDEVDPGTEDFETFFEERKENYRVPEKIQVSYVTLDPESFKDEVEITEGEIRAYYEYNLETFEEPQQVKARHILFKLSEEASEEDQERVREKAQAVLKEAREGRDFAELASQYSEGPTKSKGGDLGYFSKGTMVQPFEEAAFELKKGEISDLVRTPYGFHIIKAEDVKEAKTKSLDEVREQILEDLTGDASLEIAHEEALSLMDQMPYEVDLSEYVKGHGLNVTYSDYFSKSEPVPEIPESLQFAETLFALEEGETSDVVELGDRFYIFQVVDREPSYLPDLEEVADQVKNDFIDHTAAEKAKEAAEDYLAQLKAGKSWDDLAKEKDRVPESSEFFSRQDPIPQIGYDPSLMEKAFGLNHENRYPEEVIQNDQGSFVIRWEERQEVDEDRFQDEKEATRFALMETKQARTFQNWLDSLKEKAVIEIVTPVAGS